ncbi:MAG: hypothetical protein LBE22_09680 [Azoarcus sp.]|jgi:hypothetical protein|nr:hypothetical protein [Azoarcus sp.]
MNTALISAWIIGFVITAEPLPTGAIRLTLDNGQTGIVENPQNIELSFLLEPSKQNGFTNNGVAFKKNQQDIITEIRKARVRIRIGVQWEQASSSLVLKRRGKNGQLHKEAYLSITSLPTPTAYELHPTLDDFAKFSHVAEDAVKNGKSVDVVFGEDPFDVIHIQYSQSAFKNPPGSLHHLRGED